MQRRLPTHALVDNAGTTHYIDRGEQNSFLCPTCRTALSSKQNLQEHLLRKHNYKGEWSNIAVHECACGYLTAKRTSLDQHQRSSGCSKAAAVSVVLEDEVAGDKAAVGDEDVAVGDEDVAVGDEDVAVGDEDVAVDDKAAVGDEDVAVGDVSPERLTPQQVRVALSALFFGTDCAAGVPGDTKKRPASPHPPAGPPAPKRPYKRIDKQTYACRTCDTHCGTESKLRTHEMEHRGKPYICDKPPCACGNTFVHLHYYLRHVGVMTTSCDACDKPFTNCGDLARHRKGCATARLKALGLPAGASLPAIECNKPGCLYRGLSHDALAQHLRRMHGPPKEVLPCPEPGCTTTFVCQSKLRVHCATVHRDVYAHKCDVHGCDKAYKTAGDLKKHRLTHTTLREFVCEVAGCGRDFKSSRALVSHMAAAHSAVRFHCDICRAAFSSNAARAAHRFLHDTNPRFVCPECGFAVLTPQQLAKHERIHREGVREQGRSQGERALFKALDDSGIPFAMEHSPMGTARLRFDFAVQRQAGDVAIGGPRLVDVTLVEYDGLYHFRPLTDRAKHGLQFMLQVSRDLVKTRFCIQNRVALLRLTGMEYTAPDVCAQMQQAAVCDVGSQAGRLATAAAYVAGSAYTSPLAIELASQPPVRSLPLLDAVAILLADMAITDVDEETVRLLGEHADAVVTVFLRREIASRSDDLLAQGRRKVIHAATRLLHNAEDLIALAAAAASAAAPAAAPAASAAAEEAAPVAHAAPAADSAGMAPIVLRAGGVSRVVAIADPEPRRQMACWLCAPGTSAAFEESTKGADALLGHINTVHNNALPVVCSGCTAQFLTTKHCGDHACTGTHGDKGYECGLCSSGNPLLSSRSVFVHFNTKHGAGFTNLTNQAAGISIVDATGAQVAVVRDDQGRFLCPEPDGAKRCVKSARLQMLHEHLLVTHGDRWAHLGVLGCTYPGCAKRFASKSHLKRHVARHPAPAS